MAMKTAMENSVVGILRRLNGVANHSNAKVTADGGVEKESANASNMAVVNWQTSLTEWIRLLWPIGMIMPANSKYRPGSLKKRFSTKVIASMGRKRARHLVQIPIGAEVNAASKMVNPRLMRAIEQLFEVKDKYSNMRNDTNFVRASNRFMNEGPGRWSPIANEWYIIVPIQTS